MLRLDLVSIDTRTVKKRKRQRVINIFVVSLISSLLCTLLIFLLDLLG